MSKLSQIEEKIFLDAFELIKNPKTWTTGASARNCAHAIVPARTPEAVRFCSYGALLRVSVPSDSIRNLEKILNKAAEHFGETGPVDEELYIEFNDKHSHPEVIQMWRKAAEFLKITLPE